TALYVGQCDGRELITQNRTTLDRTVAQHCLKVAVNIDTLLCQCKGYRQLLPLKIYVQRPFAGKWALNIDFQGQQLPVTLTLAQEGIDINGNLETMLGNGAIEGGTVLGNKLTAIALADIQGR